MIPPVHPLIAIGVLVSTAATDAAYVFFNAAVSSRRRVWAANWSAICYLLPLLRARDVGCAHTAGCTAQNCSAITRDIP